MLIVPAISGCSSSQNSTTPGIITPSDITNLPVGVSEFDSRGNVSAGYGFMGLFSVEVDTSTMSGSITSLRSGSYTDVFEVVDITNFLEIAPCTDCVRMFSVSQDVDGNLVLSIGIKHPFEAGDPTAPITGRNRADLHVFNIEGLIISDGLSTIDFTGFGVTSGSLKLINADGYSRYLDSAIDEIYATDSDIHPYILHFDDYTSGNFSASNPMGFESVTNPPPSGNLVMAMGCDYDIQDYKFHLAPGDKVSFTYAVGCTYAVSSENKPDRFTPEYRIPQHNKKAASEVNVIITDNQLGDSDPTSFADLEIYVVDINHGVAVGTALDRMAYDSSVANISVEIPGVTSGVVSFGNTPVSGTGHDPSDPLVFAGTIYNSQSASEGFYPGIVKVLDSYPPGSNQLALLDQKDGIKRVGPTENPISGLFAINEFATYQVFEINVGNPELNCVIIPRPDPPDVEQGTIITFEGTDSTTTYPIINYEWDFDYDGITFDTEASGEVVDWMPCIPGTYDVALRITDTRPSSAICTVQMTITPDSDSIGDFGTDIRAGGSYLGDPNGVEMRNMGMRCIGVYNNNIYIVYEDWGGNIGSSPTLKSQQMWLARSYNFGQDWEPDDVRITNYPPSDESWSKCPSLWVDQSNGNLYVSYTTNGHVGGGFNIDYFATRSTDGGDTWSTPVQINPDPGPLFIYSSWTCITGDDQVEPSRIYVSYNDDSDGGDWKIHVARTSEDNFSTWSDTVIDDATTVSYHHCIAVNPTDHSVNAAWGDCYLNMNGTNNLYFDRSTDYGATWRTDTLAHSDLSQTIGPENIALAINPATGIPGILWFYSQGYDTGNSSFSKFARATTPEGTSWDRPEILETVVRPYEVRHGSLDVSGDGHWVAVLWIDWEIRFYESLNDGLTWSAGTNILDGSGYSVYNPNMTMDDCKNVLVCWGDGRDFGTLETTEVYFDWGS